MKPIFLILILLAFLAVYSAANYYIYQRSIEFFSMSKATTKWYLVVFIVVSYSFFLGMILERVASSAFSEWVFRIGTYWLAYMLYLLLALILIDIVRAADYFIPFLPPVTQGFKMTTGIVTLSVVTFVIVYGHVNSLIVNIKHIPISINKEVEGIPAMKILMVSDVHLGALIREHREKKLLKIVKEQQPDLVLICGDLIDSEIAPVLRKNLGKHIQEIKTPMGVYAITGNHEFIGGIDKSLSYLKSINVQVLLDSIVTLPNGVQIVGRIDKAAAGSKFGPKPLSVLLSDINHQRPVIVMNHQPYNLSEASDAKVDLHLSGHTHHGQMWPFNYITEAIFELSWGYMKKNDTHFYVSSGYGTWGPAIRLGNRPEVVVFDVDFAK